jgi:hypothetical protein
MPTHGIPEFRKKCVPTGYWQNPFSGFLDFWRIIFNSGNRLIVVPPNLAVLPTTTTTATLNDSNNVDDTNNFNEIRQQISHDGDKGVNRNGQ